MRKKGSIILLVLVSTLVWSACKKEKSINGVYITADDFKAETIFDDIKVLLDQLVYHENYLDFRFDKNTHDLTVSIESYIPPIYFGNAGLIHVGDANIGEQIYKQYEMNKADISLLELEVYLPKNEDSYVMAIYE